MGRLCFTGGLLIVQGLVLLQGSPAQSEPSPVWYEDILSRSGIDFVHNNGASGQRYPIEIMAGGVALLDYDGDDDLDIYLVNGANLPGVVSQDASSNRLYRNDGDANFWSFTDVTEVSGTGDTSYGLGCAVGDFDNDGFVDLYVTNFGPNVLYHNNGDGTFTDVTAEAGVGDERLGSSAAFFDMDADGDLDLYVLNYVSWDLSDERSCGLRHLSVRAYCHPDVFPGAPDVLFRNNGDGTFTDVTEESGVLRHEGKGLGIVIADFDADNDADIYVANDSMENYLFENRGDGTFDEVGLLAGVAFNAEGHSEAGMGVDCADVDGNGHPDILLGHLVKETNTLYLNQGNGMFTDATRSSGLGPASLMKVTFGVVFLDVDNDGDPDAFVANGHVLDNVDLVSDIETYRQSNQLFANMGEGRFEDISADAGIETGHVGASRAAAVGDFDNDGRVDLIVTNIAEAPEILRNNSARTGNWIGVDVEGAAGNPVRIGAVRARGFRESNRSGIGARLSVQSGMLSQINEVRSAAGYLSANSLRVHFGLGDNERVDQLVVQWPGGAVDTLADLEVNQVVSLREGEIPARHLVGEK